MTDPTKPLCVCGKPESSHGAPSPGFSRIDHAYEFSGNYGTPPAETGRKWFTTGKCSSGRHSECGMPKACGCKCHAAEPAAPVSPPRKENMSKFDEGVEAMRSRVLELIRGWQTNSNATRSDDAMLVLGALAADIQIATVKCDS